MGEAVELGRRLLLPRGLNCSQSPRRARLATLERHGSGPGQTAPEARPRNAPDVGPCQGWSGPPGPGDRDRCLPLPGSPAGVSGRPLCRPPQARRCGCDASWQRLCQVSSSEAESSGSTQYRIASFPGSQAAGVAGSVKEGVRDPCENDAASRVAYRHKLAATSCRRAILSKQRGRVSAESTFAT